MNLKIIVALLFFVLSNGLAFSCYQKELDSLELDLPPNKSNFSTITIDYDWDNVRIGGGGYVTGMVIHPKVPNIRYLRTDVGGGYRWDVLSSQWIPILDKLERGQQVDGIALDPNLPNRVYVALNDGIYRSDDSGSNWNKLLDTRYSGNGDLRWTGECIAVDPNNSDVLYAGTRFDGLWKSIDNGKSWSKIVSVPTANVRSVIVSPSTIENGISTNVFIGIPGKGVFESTDGGNSFSLLKDSPVSPNRMSIYENTLFVTCTKGIKKYEAGKCIDITPVEGLNKNFCGLAVNVNDPLKLIVSQRYSGFDNSLYRSFNGGTSWELINNISNKQVEALWWPQSWFSSATSSVVLDPFQIGGLFYADWFGIWHTSDIWATGSIKWTTVEKGHEEVVVLTLTAPSSGPSLYSGVCDVFGFKHDDLTAFPEKRLYNIQEGISIAYCEKYPANIAILGAKGNDGTITILASSDDYGDTWTNRTLPEGATLGKIAISSSDPDKLVYLAGGKNGAVYCSSNRGNSWTLSSGVPTGASGFGSSDVWNKDFALAADGKNGEVFYLFKDGFLYITQDSGVNWRKANNNKLPNQNNYLFVTPAPDKEGEVWVSLHKNGLYRSSDGGKNFARLDIFSSSTAFTWGAPFPGTKVPTAYCYGTVNGREGLYRSTDIGANWDHIGMKWDQIPAGVKSLAGDKKEFGKVYIGTGGRGIFFGKPSDN